MGDAREDLEQEVVSLRERCNALERELEDARHYRRAVELSPLPTMCVSGTKGRYQFVNDAFAKMLGTTLDQIKDRDPYQVFAAASRPDDFDVERAMIGRIAAGEIDSYRIQKRIVTGGREHTYQLDSHGTRDAHGRLEYVTGFFTDVEPQKAMMLAQERFDKELREAQKLGTVGKLAGGIAHDFNNRLVIIMGYGELLKRELSQSPDLGEYVEMVLTSAARAAELTQHLLAYSRRQVLNPAPFDANDMARRMQRVLSAALGERIELTVVPGAKRLGLADPGQIEQVILNLALNSRDAMPDGGKIVIETRDTSVGLHDKATLEPGDYVALVVSDTGTGIPEDVRPHIFEPFFTTKEKGYGTGLGLSIVEGIVHQSGGSIAVESIVGKGTVFTILLPRARDTAPPARPNSENAPPKDSGLETVLVCDDDGDVRELLTRILGLRAYSILSANSGKQALEVASRHRGPIHLLVTDVAMPEMGGIELVGELRKTHPDLMVLYISGYTDHAEMLTGPLGPNTFYLPKPFLPGDLTRLVSSILEKSEEA